jgi:hypothetical protein
MTSRKHNIINDTLFSHFLLVKREGKAILIVPFQVFLNGIKALAWYTFPVAVSFTP